MVRSSNCCCTYDCCQLGIDMSLRKMEMEQIILFGKAEINDL